MSFTEIITFNNEFRVKVSQDERKIYVNPSSIIELY